MPAALLVETNKAWSFSLFSTSNRAKNVCGIEHRRYEYTSAQQSRSSEALPHTEVDIFVDISRWEQECSLIEVKCVSAPPCQCVCVDGLGLKGSFTPHPGVPVLVVHGLVLLVLMSPAISRTPNYLLCHSFAQHTLSAASPQNPAYGPQASPRLDGMPWAECNCCSVVLYPCIYVCEWLDHQGEGCKEG